MNKHNLLLRFTNYFDEFNDENYISWYLEKKAEIKMRGRERERERENEKETTKRIGIKE